MSLKNEIGRFYSLSAIIGYEDSDKRKKIIEIRFCT